MVEDLEIRAARLSDVPRLLEFYKQLDITPEPEMPIEHAWARFLDLEANPLHHIYVAESNDLIVGTFAVVFVGGISHGARDSCIVEDVVEQGVSDPRRRRGRLVESTG